MKTTAKRHKIISVIAKYIKENCKAMLIERALPITFKRSRYILLLFIITRIILTLIGVLSRTLLEPYHGDEYVWIYSEKLWLDIWGVWDTGWYLGIADNGYTATTAVNLNYQADYAFFPLYPLIIRLFNLVVNNNFISGIIISNICLLTSSIYLYALVYLDESEDVALRSVKYLFLFPTAYILSGVFTESLYLALALTSFYYARKGDWPIAGSLGFLLSLTRSLGVFIFIPLLYEYLKSKPISRDISYLFLIPFGLLLFMIYNFYLTGDFLAFVHIQSAWGRSFMGPMSAIIGGLISKDAVTLFMAVFASICLLLLIVYYNKLRISYWIFGMYSLIIPLSSGLDSIPRLALVVFPLFILFAQLTNDHDLDDMLIIFLALIQGCLMVFWSNGFPLTV